MSKQEKKVKKVKEVEATVSKVETTGLDALQAELQKMREELKELRTEKKSLSDAEKAAIEQARDEMLTDDDVGVLYIDPKYIEEGYNYTICDSTRAGRIEKRIKQGYEIVYDESMQIGSRTVSKTHSLTSAVTVELGGDKGSRLGVLMRCPKDHYDKRQKAKVRRNKEMTANLMQDMANKSDFGSIEIGSDVFKK